MKFILPNVRMSPFGRVMPVGTVPKAGAQLSALDHGNLSKARNQFWGLNCRLGPGADSHECPVSGSQFMSTKAVEVQSLRLGMGPGLW